VREAALEPEPTKSAAAPAAEPGARGGRTVVLLGPQRLTRTLSRALNETSVAGRVATVTAGWQERESEDQELDEHAGSRTVNLRLYERADRLFQRDPTFAALHRDRQEELRDLQSLYDLRLRHGLEACKALDARRDRGEKSRILEDERRLAMDAVRALDDEHVSRIRTIHEEADARMGMEAHGELQRHRREIGSILAECGALAIAGGHVAVLLNRLRLFAVLDLAAALPVFAWSAGAMAATDRVVLFHDTPPHGPGNAEVLEIGLGLVEGVVALPHAHRRLLLDDTGRVSRFARRFAPSWCLAMDDGSRVRFAGGSWVAGEGVRVLRENGTLEAVGR
jgi:hypothetical protein